MGRIAWRVVGALAVLAGCGEARSRAPSPPVTPVVAAPSASASSVTPAAAQASRYRVGDYVIYGIGGSAVGAPVMLRRQIVEQTGNRLVIDVVVERETGRPDVEDRRHFRKVVTDTPESWPNDVVDELGVFPDGKATGVTRGTEEIPFGGGTHRCEVTQGASTLRGRPIRFVESECGDFVWTRGPARIFDPTTNETVLSVEIIEAGRERLCDYTKPACGEGQACAFVERDRATCVEIGTADLALGAPFRAKQRFSCTQRARSDAGRTHSFVGDLYAVDLASARDTRTTEVVAPLAGEAFVFDGCEAERADDPNARNDSRCGLGYGNHVKIWDGRHLVMLAHLARATVKNGPVKRGDVIGIEGVSGGAGQRHVHVTVTRPRAEDDVRKILTTPGWKGKVPVRWRLDIAPAPAWVDELACDETFTRSLTAP
ncbi:MAG: hypothetical protein JST00_23605 [Deltaproteobacteria bacterium]|nr:hypothetical protein [Deltaproteobacteria bacterium]